MKTVTKMIDGKEFFPAFINGKDITTTDWLDAVSMDCNNGNDGNEECTFWLYGCLFVAPDPEYYGNTDNDGWFRMVYRTADSDLNAAHRAILKELSLSDRWENGCYETRMVTEIVGNDIRYSFWCREL